MEKLNIFFAGRPFWMNALMLFCFYMTFIYMPFDIFFKPVNEDEEVWFGFVLHGWWAKATEPFHWFIYGAGAYGFFKMKRWMFPWAALYTFQIAIAMLVWNYSYGGENMTFGVVAASPFVVLGVMLLRARTQFSDMVDGHVSDDVGVTNG